MGKVWEIIPFVMVFVFGALAFFSFFADAFFGMFFYAFFLSNFFIVNSFIVFRYLYS